MFGRLKEQPPPQSLVGSTRPVDEASADVGDDGGGPRESLILLAFLLLTLLATGFNLARQEQDAKNDPAQKAARGEIKGLDELSLLREENFRKVLKKVGDSKHPLVINVRVTAVQADFTVRNEDGYRKLYSFDPALKNDVRDWEVGEEDTLAVQQIDAGAPERMVRTVAERTGQPEEAVESVTMSAPGTPDAERSWYMMLDRGPARVRQWLAAPDGSDLRKPGELSQRAKDANRARQEMFEREQRAYMRRLKRRTACLQKARSAEAASRCLQRFQP